MARVFIGIGSNLGDREAHVRLAHKRLAKLPQTSHVALSPVYETEPVGPVPQDKFLNAAVELDTTLAPESLLDALGAIEAEGERPPHEQRIKWGPRTLDLDILLYDQHVISSDSLVVPHPMMHERWFVLKPLADLDATVVHPVLQMTIGELLNYVESTEGTRMDDRQ